MSTPTHHQLARLLEAPGLERVVPALAPEALHQIIRHCGLEACSDLVALATPAQLTTLFDMDLWRQAQPGQDEQFDTVRFGEWLAALTDADAATAARTIAALDPTIVIVGLSRFVRVVDSATAEPFESFDGERIGADDESSSVAACRVGGYQVTPIQSESWDAIVTLLVALEAAHRDYFHDVMRGCRRQSNSAPEVDGLDHLLTDKEQLLHDVAADREARRSRQGYSTAADARAFLQMARQPRRLGPDAGLPNPIAAAYFRAVDEGAVPDPVDGPLPSRELNGSAVAEGEVHEALEAVAELLAAAGVMPDRPLALLEGAHDRDDRFARIRPLLEQLSRTDPGAYLIATHEMAFLTNMLVAGCSFQARAFTPDEASRAVIATCNLGLDIAQAGAGDRHDLVAAFGQGWAALHEQVAMFTAAKLVEVLAAIRAGDTRTHAGLMTLRRALRTGLRAGTPWTAREALDGLAILDVLTWTGLVGLIDECPTMPAAIEATVAGETGAVSATNFDFISTARQIARTHVFVARLPALLRG
jgi:hypothetical protein